MSTGKLDYLNIGLMITAFVLAVKLPFQLFLLSYAILGPLHYLTEIAWLDKKKYFSTNKRDVWILVALCAFVTIALAFIEIRNFTPAKNLVKAIETGPLHKLELFFIEWETSFIFLAFYTALIMAFVKNRYWRYPLMVVGVILAVIMQDVPAYMMIVGVMLPTVIHVFVFTGAFILYGALKSRSQSGYLSLAVFVVLLFLIPNMHIEKDQYQLSEYWSGTLIQSNFHLISMSIADFMGWFDGQYIILSELGIKMQIFLAYAYTYHYLNWFSKTKIINWHKVSKKSLIVIIGIWILAVALYFYDYKIGLMALFFLSILHVFLEFPLNHLTLAGIFRELKSGKVLSKKSSP